MKKNLAVCVVGNFNYLKKYFPQFKKNLRNHGKYYGEIIIITSIWCPTFLLFSLFGRDITILRFKKIKFTKNTNVILNTNSSKGEPNRNINKSFQWHKLHLFDNKLKNWNYIFYLDLKSFIHGEITQFLKFLPENELLARSDTFPEYKNTLASQFDNNAKTFYELSKTYNLNTTNYFQSSLLFYDTKIINDETKNDLLAMAEMFPCSITNEQAIFNLYFIFEKNQYKEIVNYIDGNLTFYYWKLKNEKVLITKQNRTQYK